MTIQILEKAKLVLKNGYVCDHCLGRSFAQLTKGTTNSARGKAIRDIFAFSADAGEKPGIDIINLSGYTFRNEKNEKIKQKPACKVCGNFFEKLGEISNKAAKKLSKFEYVTFIVGTKVSGDIAGREEALWEEIGAEHCEPIKAEINRELGKLLEKITDKKADFENPDVIVLLNMDAGDVEIRPSQVWIYGLYQKLVRGIPQTKWPCRHCRGKGCKKCKNTGRMYATSVEEIIAKPLLRESRATGSSFHGCIGADTNILLTRCSLPIGELENKWKAHKVVSFDPDKSRLVTSGIKDFFKIDTGKSLDTFKIITKETGREIVATSEHPFFTPSGMRALGDLKAGSKVAVLPCDPIKFSATNEGVVISENDILNVIGTYFPTSNKEKIIKELKERNLLPLLYTDENLHTLAPLVGFLFGDGSAWLVRKYSTGLAFYGTIEDLRQIKAEIEKIGFRTTKIRSKVSYSEVKDYYGKKRVIQGRGYEFTCYSKSLWSLLVSLGVPVGKKVKSVFSVPNWVRGAELNIKREFLAGLLGTETDTPRIDDRKYNQRSFNSPRFSMNKVEKLYKKGVQFLQEVTGLLAEFGVQTSKIRIIPYTTRKDGPKTFKTSFEILNNMENLVKFFGKIGFRYAKKKEVIARYAYEYLLMKKRVVDERRKLYDAALGLRSEGLSPMEIYRKLDSKYITYKDLAMWVSPKNHKFSSIKIPNNFQTYEDWIKEASKGLSDGLVWETVESIDKTNVDHVCDITTKSSSHTFFANGFLVSNSGREDIDARCLGWRPFVMELKDPVKRKLQLRKLEKTINKDKRVKVRLVKFCEKETARKIKAAKLTKTYRVVVDFERPIKRDDIKKIIKIKNLIKQRTPARVVHRRADLVRERRILKLAGRAISKKRVEFLIKTEAGMYIKELITGDDGRTEPSFAGILTNKAKVKALDVVAIGKIKV